MFAKNTQVAWVTKQNTFMGMVVESNKNTTVVLVTATARGRKWDGKKVAVHNQFLGDMTSGCTTVTRM